MIIKVDFLPKEIFPVLDCLRNNGDSPRIIGGSIRDYLSSNLISDFDIATTLSPEESKKCLERAGFNVLDTGIKYGTIKVENFEITTLRRDVKTNGRHPEVEYIDDFETDALRRDLTINSLSMCPYTGVLFDYCGGHHDIEYQNVKFIGNPEERISEDYLRILRFLRFTAKYGGGNVNVHCLNACVKSKDKLSSLSRERILNEMIKIMIIPECKNILQIMQTSNILDAIFPDIKDPLIDKINCKFTSNVNFALLFVNSYADQVDKLYDMLHNWKFPNKDCVEIRDLCNFYLKYNTIRFENEIEKEKMFYRLWLFSIDPNNYFDMTTSHKYKYIFKAAPPKFPVSSYELINKGIVGIRLGNTLKELMELWVMYRGNDEVIRDYVNKL